MVCVGFVFILYFHFLLFKSCTNFLFPTHLFVWHQFLLLSFLTFFLTTLYRYKHGGSFLQLSHPLETTYLPKTRPNQNRYACKQKTHNHESIIKFQQTHPLNKFQQTHLLNTSNPPSNMPKNKQPPRPFSTNQPTIQTDTKANLLLVGPMKLVFYQKYHYIHFHENENAQKTYSVFVFKSKFLNTENENLIQIIQPNHFLWWPHKKLKINTENDTFFL